MCSFGEIDSEKQKRIGSNNQQKIKFNKNEIGKNTNKNDKPKHKLKNKIKKVFGQQNIGLLYVQLPVINALNEQRETAPQKHVREKKKTAVRNETKGRDT